MGAIHVFPQHQIVHYDTIVSHQLVVVNPVFQISRKFAGLYSPAGKFAGVRRNAGHFHVVENYIDYGRTPEITEIQFAIDLGRSIPVNTAGKLDLGQSPFLDEIFVIVP